MTIRFCPIVGAAFIMIGALASPAFAQRAEPRNTIAVGSYAFQFDSRSSDLAGPFTPPDIHASAMDVQALAIVYSRRLTPDWSVNLAVGEPPLYRLQGEGAGAGLGSIGETRAVSPSVLVQFHSPRSVGGLTPFVGAGVSFNHYVDASASGSLEAALGGTTEVEIADTWAPIVTVGIDYDLPDRWVATVSAAYVDLAAEVVLRTGAIERTSRVDLDPTIYRLTLGYRF